MKCEPKFTSIKPGDLIGFVAENYTVNLVRSYYEVTKDQENDFPVVEGTGGKWRFVMSAQEGIPSWDPDYVRGGKVCLVDVNVHDKFICMDVGICQGTMTEWCIFLVVEQGCCVYSSRANELFEVIAEGLPG